MSWTVSRRILVGFSIILLLLVVVGGLATWSLHNTATTYDEAALQRKQALVPALRAESELRNANVAFLRYLLEMRDVDRQALDSLSIVVVQLVTQLRDSAKTTGERQQWDDALALHTRWKLATDTSIRVRRTGNLTGALRIRGEAGAIRGEIESRFNAGVTRATQAAEAAADKGATTASRAQTAVIFGALLALIIGVISAALLNRAISVPLQETSSVIASGSAEILAATTEQAASANQTLAAVSETVATVNEVAQTAEQATQRARVVADSAQRTAELGKTGRRAGRGFSVVASEIRILAEQSKRSTVQVRQILGEIQRATGAAVMTTEQGTKQVSSAGKQIAEAGETIRTLADAAQEASQAAAQIVASAGQQAIGMEQIRHAVTSIHEATQQTLTASRQSEQAAQDLTKLGGRLLSLVGSKRA